MANGDTLYQSWLIKGSYFNRMLDCGHWYNQWVENALHYLPREILDEHKENLVFIAMGHRNGTRLAPEIREREVIVLSEHVLPKTHANEGQKEVRYFIYTVLHEVAHAIRKHDRPDKISQQEIDAQEKEADDLALAWFNQHVASRNNPYLPPLTREEVEEAMQKNREIMEKQYDGV